MTRIIDLADIATRYSGPDKTRQETPVTTNVTLLEMAREAQLSREHARQLARLKNLAEVNERIIKGILEKRIEKLTHPENPHLTLVK